MLDPVDRLACQLARDRDPQPVEFEETKTNFAIRWKCSYLVDGDAFVYADQTSGRVLVSHLSRTTPNPRIFRRASAPIVTCPEIDYFSGLNMLQLCLTEN
ncbi:MAG: hypothetical protein JO207_04635 [Verrucomicrobia bacterium]|nr:hypothetical protein [Verrucomicrobiota bacterium]